MLLSDIREGFEERSPLSSGDVGETFADGGDHFIAFRCVIVVVLFEKVFDVLAYVVEARFGGVLPGEFGVAVG